MRTWTSIRTVLSLAALAWLTGFRLTAYAQTTAAATAVVSNGFVVAYTVIDGGSGYTEPPLVTVLEGGGFGAVAMAQLSSSGTVRAIEAIDAGSGYTSVPEVSISAPLPGSALLSLQMVPLLTIRGLHGDTNVIEATTSLYGGVWVPLTTVVLTNTVQEWFDTISPPGTYRFYRSVLLGAGPRPTPGPRFVWLPPGAFLMGSPVSEVDRSVVEGPQTYVALSHGFFLGRYPVTQGEYLSVIGSNPSHFTGNTNHPVEIVNWQNATNYCAQLTARERAAGQLPAGWAYRLPTEAEYEYANRAGSTNRFSYGDDPGYAQLGSYAWYSANAGGSTHEVGSRQPNRWALYDIAGNVWEWCSDWYGPYPGGRVIDPKGATSGSDRVLRGGSLIDGANSCRSSSRHHRLPSAYASEIGFRVVLAPEQ